MTASGRLTLLFTSSAGTATSGVRRSDFVSAGTTRVFIYINAIPANVGTGDCTPTGTPPTCTIAWTYTGAVPTTVTFAVTADDAAGDILSENIQPYALHAGDNGALTALTLLAIPQYFSQVNETCGTTSCSGDLEIMDADQNVIVPPGDSFITGSVDFTSSAPNVGTVSDPTSIATPASTYGYTVTCVNTAKGMFQVTATTGLPPINFVTFTRALRVVKPRVYTCGATIESTS